MPPLVDGGADRRLEHHRSIRGGWLCADVLGANDGIVSTAILVLGVAAAGAGHRTMLLTSISGLIADAMSIAAGEFVSIRLPRNAKNTDFARERAELKGDPLGEQRELTGIYVSRGLDRPLADQAVRGLMAHDAIGEHARDVQGFSATTAARPTQAESTRVRYKRQVNRRQPLAGKSSDAIERCRIDGCKAQLQSWPRAGDSALTRLSSRSTLQRHRNWRPTGPSCVIEAYNRRLQEAPLRHDA